MPPFRQPVSEEEIPEYAKEVSGSATQEEGIPSYAKEVKDEKPSSSIYKKVFGHEPSEPFKATGPQGVIQGAEDLFSKGVSAAASFLHNHPKVREAGQRLLTGTSPEFEESLKKAGITGVAGPGIQEIPGVQKVTDWLAQKVTGSGGATRLAAGALIKGTGSVLSAFDPRTSPLKAAESAASSVPIRQGREIPYKMAGVSKESPKDIELPRETPPAAAEEVIKPTAEAAPKTGVKNPFEKKAATTEEKLPEEFGPDAYAGPEKRLKKSAVDVERRASSEEPRYTPEDEAIAKVEAERLIRNPPVRAGASRPREPKILKGSDSEIPEYAKEIPAEETPKPSIEESRTPGDFQLNDAAKSSPDSLKKLNEFMDSVPKEGEQTVEQLKAGISEVPPIKMLAETEPSVRLAPKSLAKETPTSSHGPTKEYHNQQKYDLRFASDAQDAASKSRGRAMKNWAAKKAEEAKGVKGPEAVKAPELAPAENEGRILRMLNKGDSPPVKRVVDASIKDLEGVYSITKGSIDPGERKAATFLKSVIDAKRGKLKPPTVEDLGNVKSAGELPPAELRAHDIQKPTSLAERATSRLQDAREAAKERISRRGTFKGGRLLSGLPVDDLADFAVIGASHIAEGAIKFADWSTRMIKDFGDEIKPHLQKIFAAAQQQHTGNSVKELLNSLIESKGMNAEQQALYKTQRAERFKSFESAGGEGVDWAKKAMSTLKGEYEKVNPGEGLGLTPHESNSLFSAVKAAPISTPEKARGISTLFKLMNGESNLQTNEIDLLDKIFEKHFAKESGPGAAMPYDVKSGGKPINFAEAVSKKPDDFLTKLANFSSKSTRSVLGFHVPGTAISFHGFNEAIRNTVFGPDFNPFKAAGRFGQAAYYLAKPAKAAEFLDVNAEGLSRAIEEGGLKASTGDISESGMFKGDNFITKGINALTSPKPLFGQVIPALKLKSYNGLLESIEKTGVPHDKAAKMAGYATNNIFGGLNLHELQRSQNTQKLFRAAALAPDWLESNVRLGKGMFDAIKNPKAPESKVYLVGMANFLGSYVALNVLNAINNNGRFAFQNEVGHEFDIATGKDSAGRTRYFSPYGTAMDMFRIPLEIAHAAVEGNTGKLFSDARSRASEPLQFMTDLMTNTDYAGRSLYDKTKFGKAIPPLTQGTNIAGDAASHFLPIGVDAGVNLAQGKVSPEQFAAQVLQVPMKYKLPARQPGSLRLGNMKTMKP